MTGGDGNVYAPAVIYTLNGAPIGPTNPLSSVLEATEIAARAYDATTTTINAGATSYFTVTGLGGCTNISVYVVEMTQTYTVGIESRPHTTAGYYAEATVAGTAMTAGSIATKRHGVTLDGPLTSTDIRIAVKNTSGSTATIKGVYVVGR